MKFNHIFLSLSLLLIGTTAWPQTNFSIGGLKKGPYDVGFQSIWKVDTSRQYELTIDSVLLVNKQQRPILFNIWYPIESSQAVRMPHSAYFDIISESKNFASFSQALYDFNLNVVANELMGKDYNELNQEDVKVFNSYMNRHTMAIHNAPFLKNQPWPMVIYHSGAGSYYENNSILCEFLASQGFVGI